MVDGTGRQLVYDTEGNDLLAGLTTFWCLGAIDINTNEEFYFADVEDDGQYQRSVLKDPKIPIAGTLADGVKFLTEARLIVGHNSRDYDDRAIRRLYPGTILPKSRDTLITAKAIWPYDVLIGPDMARVAKGTYPAKLIKSHSLKAWGHRLGTYKDDYTGGFDKPHPDMPGYMMQDCRVTVKLWRRCLERMMWEGDDAPIPTADFAWNPLAIEVEHEVQTIILQQTDDGIRFDREKAIALAQVLRNAQADLEGKLVALFGSWWSYDEPQYPAKDTKRKREDLGEVTMPRFGKTGKPLKPYVGPPLEEWHADAAFTRITRVTFQPGSRDHIGQRLIEVYGWQPTKFGKEGKPTVDEATLEDIPPEVLPPDVRKLLLDYFVVTKTLAMISVGSKAWLKACLADGRIHGRIDTCGAVTTRATHKEPNLGQVPSVETIKLDDGTKKVLMGLEGGYGWECRELFVADEGWELTGADATALELFCLGHYLAPLDEGRFARLMSDPNRDPHEENSALTGLERNPTKTVTYAYVYGAGGLKVGLQLDLTPEEMPELLSYRGLPMMLGNMQRMQGDAYVEPNDNIKARMAKGRIVIRKFEAGITGIAELKEGVSKAATERGWIKGLDGRKLHVRKAFAALNTLLQGAGAMICKLWMVLTHRALARLGLKHGVDFKQVLWVHDEFQFTHRKGLGPTIGDACMEALRETGRILNFRGDLRGAYKTGPTWAHTH
jgi:DNA polymerase-1